MFNFVSGNDLRGTMSAIFSNSLKFQKSHLHQRNPINNGTVLQKSHFTVAAVFSFGWRGWKWITSWAIFFKFYRRVLEKLLKINNKLESSMC